MKPVAAPSPGLWLRVHVCSMIDGEMYLFVIAKCCHPENVNDHLRGSLDIVIMESEW